MIKVGLVLSGCGHRDGAEVHEASIAMLALEEAGAELQCLSLNKLQTKVVNHLKGETVPSETRNMLVEAARIARGKIRPISEASPKELDALVMPGGFGAALNLCDFAEKGAEMSVEKDLETLLLAMHEAKKPIGAICIAPVILAKVFGPVKAKITIGNDKETAAQIEKMGAEHVECAVDDCVVDKENLLVTTPAFMLAKNIKDMHPGIRKLANQVVKWAKK